MTENQKTLTIDKRILRFDETLDKLKDTLMPERHKAILIWVRLRTNDFGMSVLNQCVNGKSLEQLVDNAELAILHSVNEVHQTNYESFDEMFYAVESPDDNKLRHEIEERVINLTAELNILNEQLEIISQRQSLLNRRSKFRNENQGD